jgi:translation initiation factor eIF-2B subunit delta
VNILALGKFDLKLDDKKKKKIESASTQLWPTPISLFQRFSTVPSDRTMSTPEKTLTPKELKALRRAEKVAQRNAEGGGKPQDQRPPKDAHPKGPSKQQIQQQQKKTAASAAAANAAFNDNSAAPAQTLSRKTTLFGHLEQAVKVSSAAAHKDVHPTILFLALQISSFKVVGSYARCRAMLIAFKDVIRDYETPEGTTLSRHLTNHLSHQIEHLKSARPLSVSMGNAIRWLKLEITQLDIDLSDADAKDFLNEQIDTFIRVRLEYADRVIVETGVNSINDGDVILTYASSNVVKATLIAAHEQGKNFKVVVVDSRPLFEGKPLVRELAKAGISATYTLISGLSYVLKDVTTVFLGAHAMLSNGMLYNRVGSGVIALSAYTRNIPVVVLCESIKFSDRVLLDSVTVNELGSPVDLTNLSIDPAAGTKIPSKNLEKWEEEPKLSILNILYDVSPPTFIKKVITEVGSLAPSSVPVVLREYKSGY